MDYQLIESFSLNKGVRHGDPLSRYLFILCLNALSCMLVIAEQQEYRIKANRHAPSVHHLF